jgi:hypothetical protein
LPNVVCHGLQSLIVDPLSIVSGHGLVSVPHDVINGDLVTGVSANRLEDVA